MERFSDSRVHYISAFRKVTVPSSDYEVIRASPYFLKAESVEKSPRPLEKLLVLPRRLNSPKADDSTCRNWNDRTTKYILLKYFYWKYATSTQMSLHEMYKTISTSIGYDLGITKTSTQIRDKINNIKSAYKKDIGLVAARDHLDKGSKRLSEDLSQVMEKYFDESKWPDTNVVSEQILNDVNMLLSI